MFSLTFLRYLFVKKLTTNVAAEKDGRLDIDAKLIVVFAGMRTAGKRLQA